MVIALYTATDIECRITPGGHDYRGSKNTTVSGRDCQSWSASWPHEPSSDVIGSNFPDGSVAAAGNKCRNPDPGFDEGVWCYTTDPNEEWELCDVPICQSKDSSISGIGIFLVLHTNYKIMMK